MVSVCQQLVGCGEGDVAVRVQQLQAAATAVNIKDKHSGETVFWGDRLDEDREKERQ